MNSIISKVKKQNLFLAPFITSFVLYGFIFVAIFKSGYSFETAITIFSTLVVIIWLSLFVISSIRKDYILNNKIKTIALVIVFILLSFYFVNIVWFHNYLNLFPISTFLNGITSRDTLYHLKLAESFLTYGYPSSLINNPNYFPYHYLSHLVIAFFSKLLNVQCLIIYSYVYPIVFIPLYVYLFQVCVLKIRVYLDKTKTLTLTDYVFMILIFIGFFSDKVLDTLGIFWSSTIISESYFLSIVFLLIYINAFFYFIAKKSTRINNFVKFVFTPIFIILLAGMKISTGFLFFVGISFILFRINPTKIKTYLFILYYFLFMIISYALFSYGSGQSSIVNNLINISSDVQNKTIMSNFEILHYAKHYVQQGYYLIHYLLAFLPALFLFIAEYNKSVISQECEYSKKNVIIELAFILSIIGNLPGTFIPIVGGSAAYFSLPALFISLLLVLSYDIPNKVSMLFSKKFKVLIFAFMLVLCFSPIYNTFNIIPNIISTTIESSTNTISKKMGIHGILTSLFKKDNTVNNQYYRTLTEIQSITKDKRYQYCIFIDDSSFTNKLSVNYDSISAIQAFLGITVINNQSISSEQELKEFIASIDKKKKFIIYLYNTRHYQIINID